MAGFMENVRRRNTALDSAVSAARSTRAPKTIATPKARLKTIKRPKPQGLRAAPQLNAPHSISGGTDARSRRLQEIQRKIKALGG